MIKSLKHLILALFVFLGFSQTPTAAETIIMACDTTYHNFLTNEKTTREKFAVYKGEFGAFASEVTVRIKGEWTEYCAEYPGYVRGTREVTYLDKAAKCERKDYVVNYKDKELMFIGETITDFAVARIDGKLTNHEISDDGTPKVIGERTWHDCEIQQ